MANEGPVDPPDNAVDLVSTYDLIVELQKRWRELRILWNGVSWTVDDPSWENAGRWAQSRHLGAALMLAKRSADSESEVTNG